MQRDPFRFNGTVIDGQFRIDQWIGEGGFSNVYKGFHLGLNEPIAVKCLKPIADSPEVVQDFVNRFRDESRIAYRLSQGNLDIVRCIASGTTLAPVGVRVPYMVLEWLEGESLAIHFRGRRDAKMKGRSLKEAFDMFTPAGEAIVFAHSHGIVHRDIKPGNLFLTKSRQGGVRLKVLDFGMAKVMSDGSSESTGFSRLAMSMQNIAIFSPPYAAPEQFDPTMGPISAKVDVYSFALVFLEAMLDRRVRTGETDAECLIQACKPSQPITPRGLGLTVPDAVERLFTQACATNPRERPQSMEEFWGKLRNAMQADSKKQNNAHDDPQDWGDVADSIPPDADGPATIVADTEGLFEHEPPSAPPLPPIPGPAPLPSHHAHPHPQPHHAHASPHAVPHLGDDESTRTIDVNQLPSPPGQPPQQPIPPEVKDFLQRTGLAASARMPSPSAPSPQAGSGPAHPAKPFARPSQPGTRPSQPGGFHLPRPSIPRPEGSAGRLPAPLPAAGTPAEGVAARSDSANGRAAPRPTTGTTAMPIQAPRLPSLSGGDETGPSSSDMPTTVGQLNDMPIQGPPQAGGAARFDLASAETQFAPDAPAPFGAPPQQPPFFASPPQAPAGNPKNKTLALSATPFAQQFSNTPPVDPDAEAPTQAQFAPQLQDAMTYQPPPFAHPPQPQPQHGGYPPPGGAAPSPYGASGGTSAMPQFSPPDPGASPFGNYGAPGGGPSPFGAPGGGGGQYGPPPGAQQAPQQQGMMQQQPGMAGAPPWQPQQGAPQGYAAQQGFAPPGPVPGAAPYAAQPQKPKLILIGLIAALAVILLIGAGYAAYSLLSSSNGDPNAAPSASAAPQAPSAPAPEVAQPTPTGAAVAPQPPPEPPAPPPVQQPAAAAQPAQPAQQPAAEAPHRSSGSSDRGSSDRGSTSTGSGSGSSGSTSSGKSTGSSGSTTGSGPTPITRPSAGPSEPGKFSPEAARASLKTMEGVLASCKKPDGPTGPGRARVTFIGDGSVMSSVIVGPPYEGTPVGDCVATRFKFAKVPKFEGNPGVVDYNFTINK